MKPCKERELQLANGKIKQQEAESAQHQQRVRDLEEQIQSDDRAERLEESLQNTRDRADELELKLTKLKQVWFAPTLAAFPALIILSCSLIKI